jgi:transcription initiation factor IIF auxiliary subunit
MPNARKSKEEFDTTEGTQQVATCQDGDVLKPSVGSEELGLNMGSETTKQHTSTDDQILIWQLNADRHMQLPVEADQIDEHIEAYSCNVHERSKAMCLQSKLFHNEVGNCVNFRPENHLQLQHIDCKPFI